MFILSVIETTSLYYWPYYETKCLVEVWADEEIQWQSAVFRRQNIILGERCRDTSQQQLQAPHCIAMQRQQKFLGQAGRPVDMHMDSNS